MFIGKEFKNYREHLIQALSESAAWRHGALTATPSKEEQRCLTKFTTWLMVQT